MASCLVSTQDKSDGLADSLITSFRHLRINDAPKTESVVCLPEERSTSKLLLLPAELRDKIWAFAALNGTWPQLELCCSQIRQEVRPHRSLPLWLNVIESVTFIVDTSYDRFTWLKVLVSWRHGRKIRTMMQLCRDIQDPFLQHLRHTETIRDVDIKLVAPRSGDFIGAFLMMFAKACDVARWTRGRHFVGQYRADPVFDSDFHISFETEKISAQDTGLEKSFWECRFDTHLVERTQHYHYEYFLAISWAADTRASPLAQQRRVTLPTSLDKSCSTLADPACASIIRALRHADLREARLADWEKTHESAVQTFATWVETWSLTGQLKQLPRYGRQGNVWQTVVIGTVMHNIKSDLQTISIMYSYYMNSHKGPKDGPLDRLKLHQLRTRHKDGGSFFGAGPSPLLGPHMNQM